MRVIIAAIGQETNSFSPIPSPLARFGRKPGPFFGTEALNEFRNMRLGFSAFVHAAEKWGAEIEVPIVGRCMTGGPVEDEAFDFMAEKLLDSVRKGADAVLLDLHGAMLTASGRDEGDLLHRVREIAPGIPIAVPWDFHGTMNERKVRNATIGVGYKTAPHTDIYETGELAARLIHATMNGEVRPVTIWGNAPMLGDSACMSTSDPAMADLMKIAADAEKHPKVLACSVFGGCAKSDTREAGPSCVVITDNDPELGKEIRDSILAAMWERREHYVFHAEPLAQSVARAKALNSSGASGPVILSDSSDNCNSGGTNDDMTVVKEAMRQGLKNVAVTPVCHPEVAAAMHKVGNGATLTVELGHKVTSLDGSRHEPLRVTGVVSGLSTGELVVTGPVFTGTRRDLGLCGCLDCGDVQFVVTSERSEPFDLGVYALVGIDPRTKDYLIMKGGGGLIPVYETFAAAIINCYGTGSVKPVLMAASSYRHVRRPIYPLDEGVTFSPERP